MSQQQQSRHDEIITRLKRDARLRPRGNRFEDFTIGRQFDHHWGRSLTEADNTQFTILTLHYNPLYTNADYARKHDHRTTPVNPLLVFNTVFGLTVEDLSEGGGPFLGVNELEYGVTVYPGDTLYAKSEVIAARLSEKRQGFGIVSWHTIGRNQHGEQVISYQRSNLVRVRA